MLMLKNQFFVECNYCRTFHVFVKCFSAHTIFVLSSFEENIKMNKWNRHQTLNLIQLTSERESVTGREEEEREREKEGAFIVRSIHKSKSYF